MLRFSPARACGNGERVAGTPAGSLLTIAARLSPWLSPAVEKRSIYLTQPKERL